MKKSTKAALASTLVFPGTGHFFLRRWLRGLVFLLPALLATGYLVNYTVDRTLDAADRILSGEVAMDPEAIQKILDEKPPRETAMLISAAGYILLACWVVGGIDAYQLGAKAELVPPVESEPG